MGKKYWKRFTDYMPEENKLIIIRDERDELLHGKLAGESPDGKFIRISKRIDDTCNELKYISYNSIWMYAEEYFKQ